AHRLRYGQLHVDEPVIRAGMAVATADGGRVSRVEDIDRHGERSNDGKRSTVSRSASSVSSAMIDAFLPQRGGDRVAVCPVDLQYLFAAAASGDDPHTSFRDAEMLCNEFDQGAVGGVLHRRRRDADLDHAIVSSGKLRPGGTRLYVDFEANRRHSHGTPAGSMHLLCLKVP